MALPILDRTLDHISRLSDLPNDTDGLSAAELKAEFDANGQDIKEYVNETLLPALESAIDAAAQGVGSGGKIDSDTLRDGAATTPKIADGAVTDVKIHSVDGSKIITESIPTTALEDDVVTYTKLAVNAVRERNIKDEEVTHPKLAAASVWEKNLASNSVVNEKVKDGTLNISKTDGSFQALHKTQSVLLVSGTTSWTESVSGVTANNTIMVSPAPSSFAEYGNCGVHATAQGDGTLTFEANVAPAENLTVNIIILD